jgi:flagellar motility protein MotE (MotC chaperone)
MKNFFILGLVALLLFSISASLSLWLNQSRASAEADKTADKSGDKEKPSDKDKGGKKAVPATDPHAAPPPHGDPKADALAADAQAVAALRDREFRLERRAAQIELITRDLQAQQDAVEALSRQLAAELKTATAKSADLEALANDLDKRKVDLVSTERKNIEKMAAMYDSMAPESAALIMKQMADTGKLDMAVKILSQMKERQAARVLAELADPSLAAQLLERMRGLKLGGVAPAPVPITPIPPVSPPRGP